MTPTPIIFDFIQPINRKARARRTDPATSHDAAKRVELGKAEQQRQFIKHYLEVRGPQTVHELASYSEWTAHELGKRVGEISTIQPTGQTRQGSRVWALCNATAAPAQ
jgi:hypothetical protein